MKLSPLWLWSHQQTLHGLTFETSSRIIGEFSALSGEIIIWDCSHGGPRMLNAFWHTTTHRPHQAVLEAVREELER